MEGFAFNFFAVGSAEQQLEQQQQQDASAAAAASGDPQLQQQDDVGAASEVFPDAEAPQAALQQLGEVQLDQGIRLLKGRVSSEEAASVLSEPQLQASDLVPNRYEGGFKLWEGAVDLCNYLIQHFQITPGMLAAPSLPGGPLQGKRVLELGCGHGLPGLLCLLAGATVHFQDFNRQVITHLTRPNVAVNLAQLPRGSVRGGTRYFAGDWAAVGQLLASGGLGGHYDLILAAETIYSAEAQQRLLQCIKQVLQPPHGQVLVAAKSFYFGVGGSTAGFATLLADDGTLECARVWAVEDGASNKREVLRLRFPESITPYFL